MAGVSRNRVGEKVGFGPLPVCAVVYNIATGQEVASHKFDFNDLEKRLWLLEKVIIWSLFNSHSVEIFAEKDDA